VAAGAATVAATLVIGAALLLGQTATGGTAAPPATPTPSWSPVGPVLRPATPRGPPPSAKGLASRLDPLLAAPALGGQVGATVVDVASGEVLWDRGGTRPAPPASSVKIATAVAALAAIGPQATFHTRVVQATPGEIVLVGGGDPMLAAASGRGPEDTYASRSSLPELARATAAALRETGVAVVQVAVDDTRFAGPAVNPAWERRYVSSGNALPVSALTLDADAERPAKAGRGADPALVTGRKFAAALAKQGIEVHGKVAHKRAPTGGVEFASVSSPTVAVIVEQLLATSDNDLAEILARHVAAAEGAPPTFAGAAEAVARVLRRLEVDTPGLRLIDGSGLARGNRVSPRTLAGVVAVAASPAHSELRAALSGLPVAGFTGTLADRFDVAATRPAAGTVRAKTGTLTGVSSLTGVARDADGRVLAFSFIASRVPAGGTVGAAAVLDRLAAGLAACGCP
jgi:D-alanyl-D-alanine carboxypeptidase/D-alanyl-D-alanine-endopeptidase (penicillin-binding protein 4)